MHEQDAGDSAQKTPPSHPAPARLPARLGWSRSGRWLTGIAVVLVIVLVAGATTAWVVVRKPWPQTSGELQVAGLDGPVQVVRDGAGVPHIYADSMHDLMLAQGFVHAQDRFFEMDVRRHATAGRLAELFGAGALESDLVVRTLGWREVASRELTMLQPATRGALDAYAEGVNAYLKQRSPSELALEYSLLGLTGVAYTPERWSAVDSIAWLKAMAWDLRGNLDEEIGRALTAATVGDKAVSELYPDYPYAEHPPVVEQGAVVRGKFDQGADAHGRALSRPVPGGAGAVQALAQVAEVLDGMGPLLGKGDGLGSNAWVVDGSHTTTGAPILANDPHLGTSLPGVWTQVGLHCRTVSSACPLDVSGFGFSGVPGVVIGHNAHIAWGFTNLGPDVTDLFVERISGNSYEYDGRRIPLTLRTETIEVRDADPVELTVRSTGNGPLLSDLSRLAQTSSEVELSADGLVDQVDGVAAASGTEGAGVSLAWTALEPRPTADALLALNAAEDFDEFHEALRDFAAPGQNILYADTEGHIGYQATGVVPVRGPANDGRTPAPGWRPDAVWTGTTVPYDALPRLLDPDSGIIATANQAVIDPRRYPPFLTDDWDQGYRSTRINDLLRAEEKLDVAAMSRIQLDSFSAVAQALVPYLLEIDLPGGYYSDGQKLLADWDLQQDADSAAAAYFNAVWREVLDATFSDELPEVLEPDGSDRWFRVVADLLPRAHTGWWDDVETDVVEDRDTILRAAMIAARDQLTARQSPNAEEWRWGALHELELRSQTLGESGIGIVERLFNRGGWEAAGGSSIVNATGWDARDGFEVRTAPSMRMVVPLDDLDAARWINLTGVSGHAFHPHYTDQTDLWARGETLPWAFTQEAVEKAGADVLDLQPSD
ncbi:penicillin acylase family protein [Nocardioides sp. zg-ZUI104]|uniref:penicillin acylase family protein n=1 Tax=Nocardioides faecalis TaxID=2803858 RepID=UPI001BD0D55F|nr:penicillin acylase family protein [Nocardioides faecalis]MBS4751838.1 penicillin acylase family protein [Nocardioides faecalis]